MMSLRSLYRQDYTSFRDTAFPPNKLVIDSLESWKIDSNVEGLDR